MTVDPGASRGQDEMPAASRGQDEVPAAPRAQQELTADELLRRLEADGELTVAELAALARLDGGPDDDDAWDCDLGSEPPPGWDRDPDRDCGAGSDSPARPAVPEAFDAGFTHREGGNGDGFAAGGPLDVMLPGPELARHVGAARRTGLGALSDDELVGVLVAARRLGSWQADLELAAVAELDARRAGPGGREGEHVAEEIAAALTLTGRSADTLLELSRRLERLPATRALLAAGIIDRTRAAVIADQLALLPDADAAAVEDRIAPRAGGLTTGQLRAACQRAVLAHDPQAAIRRREKAEQDARVECWAEGAGTSAIAGRDLAPAGVIAADKTLDADARWLHQHGAPGTHDQLRAQAMVARLTGQPLASLLPQPAAGPASPGSSPDPAAPGSPRHWPAGPAGPRPGRLGEPDHARCRLARPGRLPRRDRRAGRRRRRHLPRPGRRPGRPRRYPLVPDPDRPPRPRRGPRLRPCRTRPARQPRSGLLARSDHDHSDRVRDLCPSPRISRLPATGLAAAPDQDP